MPVSCRSPSLPLCLAQCEQTPNGLAPLSAEHVRPARGVDPVTYPSDRYLPSVACTSAPTPDGLLAFSYALPNPSPVTRKSQPLRVGGAWALCHVFTRNRPAAQAEPGALFREIQECIVLVPKAAPAVARGGFKAAAPVYTARFASGEEGEGADEPGVENKVQRGERNEDVDGAQRWPVVVVRARELMRRRARLVDVDVDGDKVRDAQEVQVDYLTIEAWKGAGNKKVSRRSSPVPLCHCAALTVARRTARWSRTARLLSSCALGRMWSYRSGRTGRSRGSRRWRR